MNSSCMHVGYLYIGLLDPPTSFAGGVYLSGRVTRISITGSHALVYLLYARISMSVHHRGPMSRVVLLMSYTYANITRVLNGSGDLYSVLKRLINNRPRRDSNSQSSDSKSDALSIRPRGLYVIIQFQ